MTITGKSMLRTANLSNEGDEVEDPTPRLLRIREVAADLNVSETTVRRWLTSGKLEGIKVGGIVRVAPKAIERFVTTHPYRAATGNAKPSALARLGRTLRKAR